MSSVRLGKKTWADDIVGEPIKVVEKRDRRICTAMATNTRPKCDTQGQYNSTRDRNFSRLPSM